jgi:hypothetical protein
MSGLYTSGHLAFLFSDTQGLHGIRDAYCSMKATETAAAARGQLRFGINSRQ